MTEFFDFAFAPANLFYSLLLCVVLLYWMTVVLGALDLDFLDFEVDTDVDVDIDVDADIDSDIETEIGGGGGVSGLFLSTLSFFNIGQVPFMIFISIFAIVLWGTAMFFNNAIGNTANFGLWLFPNLLVGLFLSKIFTTPFKAFHKQLNKGGTNKKELVGKIAKVTLEISPGRPGQAKIDFDDHHFLLTVRSDEEGSIPKGSQVILTEYREERGDFLVNSFDI